MIVDEFISDFDRILQVITGNVKLTPAIRPNPASCVDENSLISAERRLSASLMRINHVGEICAQALYSAQGRFARDEMLSQQFREASREEQDHLVWTAERIGELNSHVSLLNPIWYASSYLLGTLVAILGDKYSLDFVLETELQVEEHLNEHLKKLPLHDLKSRAIVERMRDDEILHGEKARNLGAAKFPFLVRGSMWAMSRVMTTICYYV